MAKEELLEMRGNVVELLPNAMFRVRLIETTRFIFPDGDEPGL